MKYVALLRGINVGGSRKIVMAELREIMKRNGFEHVQTYIQSGNIIFESSERDVSVLVSRLEDLIKKEFGHAVPVVLLSQKELETVVDEVPSGWMQDPAWKYNYLFLQSSHTASEVIQAVGKLKPDIEKLTPGKRVVYQELLFTRFGQTTSGKLTSMPVYKIMTIRNHNTVTKLVEMIRQI
jgi:uncharacterized protein (DUF1697 family)